MTTNHLDQRLQAVFAKAFSIREITDAVSIDSVPQWDSLGHIGLILALEAEFQISIAPAQAIEMISVRAIREILTELGVQ